MSNYTDSQKLSFKDLQNLLEVSEASAKRYLSDIKKDYGLKVVLFCHFKQYFKITA